MKFVSYACVFLVGWFSSVWIDTRDVVVPVIVYLRDGWFGTWLQTNLGPF